MLSNLKKFLVLNSVSSATSSSLGNFNDKVKKVRLLKYDNLRGLGILLVVLFHLMNPFSSVPFYGAIAKSSMIIIMPVIFFVSGYFSKVDENTEIKAFKGIFIPYIFFCTLWIIFTVIVLGSNIPKMPYIVPARGLWYLLTLFLMRLFLPIFVRIKHFFWIMIAGSLLIGLVTFGSNIFAFTKFIYYLPLFMLGYYFKNSDYYLNTINPKLKGLFLKIKDFFVNYKLITFGILALLLISLTFVFRTYPSGFFSFELSYSQLDLGNKIGMLMRLLVLLASLFAVILMNYLMTDKETFLTKIGKNSLAVYVLHFYFTRILDIYFIHSDLGSFLLDNPYLAGVYIVITALIITYVLSRDFITNILNKIFDIISKIFIKPAPN
ncbi:hypothetical protein SDC9_17011 [bioreactor metagenome]|uniref:Acyltransferase 3 domain-containing protein n=1 Tax=bioreactor metagenome TaxID=1076179 RepID=A0A644TXR4_9ZZZZ|nr:acyltransferase family protein [Methanobrevibacter sp.]MEA4957118.1 acyltransferase family protein [Methanobrevibacter sp.]